MSVKMHTANCVLNSPVRSSDIPFHQRLHLDFQLGDTVDVAVNKLPHFYQRAYAGRNIFT